MLKGKKDQRIVQLNPPDHKSVNSASGKISCEFEVISRIYKIAFHSIHNEKQKEALYNHRTPLFESLPETRCSVNAILKGKSMYRSSHPPYGE